MRNNVEASSYRDYIFPLLFFKRISDVYDEDIENAKKEYGDAWTTFPEEEIHDFSIPEGCHWRDLRSVTDNVGSAIQKSFQGIEGLNADKLGGVFGNANWANKAKLSNVVEYLPVCFRGTFTHDGRRKCKTGSVFGRAENVPLV